MSLSKAITVLFVIVSYGASTYIPPYVNPCKLNDPSFETCALSLTKEIFDHIRKGDEALKVPPLTSYTIPVAISLYDDDFALRFRNSTAYGIDNANPVQIKKTPNENKLTAIFKADHLVISSDLYINAKIKDQRVFNHGIGNISLYDTEVKFTFTWQPGDSNGIKSTEILNEESDFTVGSIALNIDFVDIDEEAGSKLNKFLNENSEEIKKKIIPSIKVYWDELFSSNTNVIFNQIPYAKLFEE